MRYAFLVAERELRETLRDGRVLGMFLLPLILYPSMLWGMSQYLLLSMDERAVVAWSGDPETPEWLGDADVDWVEGGEDDLASGRASGWVRGARTEEGVRLEGALSGVAYQQVQRALGPLRAELAKPVADARGLPATPPPVRRFFPKDQPIDLGDLSSELAPLAPLLPGLALCLIVTMVFYPALDAAGERHRGTLVTSLLAPHSGRSWMWGKILTVSSVALLAVFGQSVAMGLSFAHFIFNVVVTVGLDGRGVIWPELPDALGLLALIPVGMSATAAVSAVLLIVAIPWKTQPTAEMAGSLGMMALLGWQVVGAWPSPWMTLAPVANLLTVTVSALHSELSPWMVVASVGANLLLVVALAEVGHRIASSTSFRT